MKTILFFDRDELTDLYASLSLKMKDDFNIVHVAYSLHDKKKLIDKYGINPVCVFLDHVADRLGDGIDHLTLHEIDALIIKESEGRFCLNSSIQSDRAFALLSNEEALLLAQSQYKVWKEIFEKYKIDFFYHEPPAIYLGHIASLLCLAYNARYCYDSMVKGENKYNYILLMQDTAFAPELNWQMDNINEQDVFNNKERINSYISQFRETYGVYLGDIVKSKINYFQLLKESAKSAIICRLRRNRVDKLKNNIEYYLLHYNQSWNKLKNVIGYKFKVKFEDLDTNCRYYYYSMNLEPEATVLYLGDGIYENQTKLIVNIASQLPPGTYLYVKDHPHFIGYRNYQDYVKLMSVPNIKLLKAGIPGKRIIKDSLGVFMVNGTAGLEAILLNKRVYTFGNMFFNICERVKYIKNIKDLREEVYKDIGKVYQDDYALHKFVLAFLNSTHIGVSDFFHGRMGLYNVDHEENTSRIAKDLTVFFKNYPDLKAN